MTVNSDRARRALGVLLANAGAIGGAEPDRPVEELLGVILGEPEVDPVKAVGALVRVLREASAALAELDQEVEVLRTVKTEGVRLGIGFTHNADGSRRTVRGTGAERYGRRIE